MAILLCNDTVHISFLASSCNGLVFDTCLPCRIQELYAFHADMGISLANDLLGLQSKVRLMAHAMEALKETHATTVSSATPTSCALMVRRLKRVIIWSPAAAGEMTVSGVHM